MTNPLPPLVVSRRPRHPGASWADARSWLGGAPRLGSHSWPRGGAGRTPLPFVAQIDLAEVAAETGPTVLPSDGSLAFFLGVGGGCGEAAVLHLPRSAPREPTPPPPDALPVLDSGDEIFPERPGPSARPLFPFWPVAVTALDEVPTESPDIDDDEANEAAIAALVAAVDRRFTRREYFLTAKEAFRTLADAPRPFWWHSARHYASCLRTALRHLPEKVEARTPYLEAARREVERLRPKAPLFGFGRRAAPESEALKKAKEKLVREESWLAAFEGRAPEFARFVEDVEAWAEGHDPWAPMPAEAVEHLRSFFERGRKAFDEFTRFRTPHGLDDLETETLLTLLTAEERAYATLPEPVRTLVNGKYLLPTGSWHQMFGRGVEIQGDSSAMREEGNVMLLQLVYDDLMRWRFGDMGAYQFWIAPADLARQNWGAVRVTFECH